MKIIYIWILCLFGSTLQAAPKKVPASEKTSLVKEKDASPAFCSDEEDASLAVNPEVECSAAPIFSKAMRDDSHSVPSPSENSSQFQDEQASPELNSSKIKKIFSEEEKINIMAALWHQTSAERAVCLKGGLDNWLPVARKFFHTVRCRYPQKSAEECKEFVPTIRASL